MAGVTITPDPDGMTVIVLTKAEVESLVTVLNDRVVWLPARGADQQEWTEMARLLSNLHDLFDALGVEVVT